MSHEFLDYTGMSYDGQHVYAAVSDGAGKRSTDANGAQIRILDRRWVEG